MALVPPSSALNKDSRFPPPALIITPSTFDMGQVLHLGFL